MRRLHLRAEDYREIIDGVVQFLSGDTEPIQRDLERRMREAAEEERFEEAARYRNRLFSIQHLAERQAADRRDVGDVDVLGLALDGDHGVVQIFPLRGGKMIDRYSFHVENVEERDVDGRARGVLRRVLRCDAVGAAADHRAEGGRRSLGAGATADRAARVARRSQARASR